jgi:biotin carboxyl carrier protein
MARERHAQVAEAEEENGRQTIGRLADQILPLLIARLGASGLGELEVRQDGWRVRLRRGATSGAAAEDASRPRAAGSPAPRPPDRRHDSAGQGESPDGGRRERGRLAISSPAVGYYQPRDGLAVGASVRGGDLLGHVDVLGVRQDVVAPEDGIVAVLSAQPGEAVEYGQTLARLEPAEGRP